MIFNFEHPSHPIASWRRFLRRVMICGIVAACLDVFALVLGALGFHFVESAGWLEATLNAR